MKRTIWIHIDSYRPNGNAPANRAFAFAKYFSTHGYNVNIITIGKENDIITDEYATIYYLKNSFHFKKKNIVNRLISNISFAFKTRTILKKHKEEIEDSYYLLSVPEYISAYSSLIVKNMGAKLILDVRDIWPEVAIEMGVFSEKSIMAKIFSRISKEYYLKSDMIFTVSEKKTQYLKSFENSRYKEKVFWIGNGFDLDVLDSVKKNIEEQVEELFPHKFVVSYVGNIGKAQHLDDLIEYARNTKHTNILFVFAGEGADYTELKNKSENLHLKNVVFMGKVSKEKAILITQQSHISFIPLASDNMVDSVPTKLFESLGIGTPVLLVGKGESVDILQKTNFGISLLPSKINELDNVFDTFLSTYSDIINNREHATSYIIAHYSRQKYCDDALQIINQDIKTK